MRRFVNSFLLICSITLGGSWSLAQTAGSSFIYLDSDPSDYVGQGEEITSLGGTFSVRRVSNNGIDIIYRGVGTADPIEFANLSFAAPRGRAIGVRPYEGAHRYPFQSPKRPGLSVSANSRGCNELRGDFDILELEIVGNTVRKFAANFVQYCDGGGALWGAVRYQSHVRVRKPIVIGPAPVNPHDPTPHIIMLKSPAGEYIGAGLTQAWGPNDGIFTSQFFPNNNGVAIRYEGDALWNLEFAAPIGSVLAPGTYLNAKRIVSRANKEPGLDVSGDGRGCNEILGQFTVLQLTKRPNGTVKSFAVDFTQRCDGGMPLQGAVRFNSTIPLPVYLQQIPVKSSYLGLELQ